MILDLITCTTTITSGASALKTALTFDSSNSPMKVVRFYGTMGAFASTASGSVCIYSDTDEALYESATIAPTASINIPLDCNVFPGYSVRFKTTGDIGAGNPSMTVKAQLER